MERDLDDGCRRFDLRHMTFGRHHDTDPILSPSGSRLLFVSDCGRVEGLLWVMPVDGGEARRLTDFPLELSEPVFSPDGRWVATTAKVCPECGADAECNRTTRDRWEEGPLDAHLADRLLDAIAASAADRPPRDDMGK